MTLICLRMNWTEQEYNAQRAEFVWALFDRIKKEFKR